MIVYLVRLAWKNVWRNRRRTILTVGSIGVGVMSLITIYNYYDAFHDQVVRNVIRYQSGHLVASAPSLISGQARFLRNPKQVRNWLSRRAEVKAAAPRLQLPALLSSARFSANVAVIGVDPDQEKRVTSYWRNIVAGNYFKQSLGQSKKPVVLGRALARLLKVEVGSKLVAMSQGVDGSIGNELFYVVGIFETHSDADKNLAFVLLSDARGLISAPNEAVHQFAVVLHSDEWVEQVQSQFTQAFSIKVVRLQSWKDLQKPLMALIDLNQSANRLLMLIILAVAAFGIANSIFMSVLERTREFGVMVAIGSAKSEIGCLVLFETLLLSLLGALLGNALGTLVTWFFGFYGFDLKWLTNQSITVQGMILQTVTYPEVHWGYGLQVSAAILVLALGIAVIPLRYIMKLEPVRAIRG